MRRFPFLIAALLLVTSCVREEPAGDKTGREGAQVTIRVSMPEHPFSKVAFSTEGENLHLAWQDTDCIRVISGDKSEVFTVSRIISDHEAEFSGKAVSGSSFTILCPGTYASVEAAEEDTASPAQTANGSPSHLKFKALLSGVDAYQDVAFKADWAQEHGGSFKQGAAVKIQATLPAGTGALKKVGIGLGGRNYTLPLENVSADANVLTAYMMLPWVDIPIPADTQIPVYVMDADNEAYSASLPISAPKTILQGRQNSFSNVTLALGDFVAGDGTEENPYLIANARQLNNMHSVMKDNTFCHFRLLEDIDASSITNWAPLNNASGFSKAMDFDGDGHTISNLTSTGANYASFCGVLNGHIHDVTFDGASMSHTSKIGVVGGFIGTSGVVGSCTNVHVKNSTVTGGSQWVGGFAGEINTTGTLEGCSVENTTATSTSHIGEFAGIVRGQVATLRNCYTKNFSLAHNTKPADTQGLGGFVGCTTANAVFDHCHVEGTVSLSSDVTPVTENQKNKKIMVGGFIGYIAAAAPVFNDCYVEGTGVELSGKAEVGGFVAYNDRSAAYTRCRVTGAKVSGIYYLGGFMGYGQVTSGYEVPSIFTDCVVDGVTVSQNLSSESSTVFTGGFAGVTGQAFSFINCAVTGTSVTATQAAVQNVGGFVGCTTYAGANFQGCTVDNTTTVTAKAPYVGGFVGWANVPDAYKDCSTAATVNNNASYTGGFVGYAAVASAYTGCHASGNVSGQRFTGGFVGVAENASFMDCYYSGGTVTANTNNNNARCGAFIGVALTGVSLLGCHVSGATMAGSGAGRVGGFAGELGNSSAGGNNVTTSRCYVENTSVHGAINTGGFVGVQYETTRECYVSGGSVTAHGSNCGGFSGFIQNGDIAHCYTTASVSGGSYSPVGGMIGIAYTTTVSCCYAAGSLSGSGEHVGAFVGQCAQQGSQAVATISQCIGWGSQPFCASNTVGATISNVYAGTDGTVSSRASAQSWPASVWNLSGDLPVLVPGAPRIPAVFIGDSITWQWARASRKDSQQTIIDATHGALGNEPLPSYMTLSGSTITTKFHPEFFAGNGYVDKGISGQQTRHMRERFLKDVIELNPKVFVVMAGTNDIANAVPDDTIFENIAWMASTAKEAGIQVVICSITPNNREYGNGVGFKSVHIEALNERFQTLCSQTEGYTYCDYWTSLVARSSAEAAVSTDIDHGLKDGYKLYDDLHPGPAAYTVMEGIIKPIIDGLL